MKLYRKDIESLLSECGFDRFYLEDGFKMRCQNTETGFLLTILMMSKDDLGRYIDLDEFITILVYESQKYYLWRGVTDLKQRFHDLIKL